LTDIDDARHQAAELTSVLQEQIELLKMAQEAIKREMKADLSGGTPILHRDVANKMNGITRSMAEAGRVQVLLAKAHKELAGAFTPDERVKATARYLKTLTNNVLNALLHEVLEDRRQLAEKVKKPAAEGPKTAVDAMRSMVGEAPGVAE
jgi:hypothetical protein